MTRHFFALHPFPAPNIPDVSIAGNISRQNNLLTLHYFLAGNTNDVLLPLPSPDPTRKDELWKATCFEFFLAVKDQPQYWEFNMSPSGDWNVYRMDSYRRIGFRQETSVQQLQFKARVDDRREGRNEAGAFTLNAAVDLSPIVPENQSLEVGITAILQTKDSHETYWALTHPAPWPDFHLRNSFILALAG